MSYDEPPTMSRWERQPFNYKIWIWLAPLLGLLLVVLLYYFLSGSSSPMTNRGAGPGQAEDRAIEEARQSLARQTDLTTCQNALAQINSELSEKAERRAPPLTPQQNDWLRTNAGLKPDELAEVESGNYTRLDGHHLDRCFLLRDAGRTLEVKGVQAPGGAAVREAGLERAKRAFAWTMREVRLRMHGGGAAPPAFVLRRGWGTGLERALVFLALLEQIGDLDAPRPELLGCLLHVSDTSGQQRFWACGVVVGDGKDLYLFDPRLGLPLPGPKGEGVATLAEVRKQPDVLAQLDADKLRYDVTAEQARDAQVRLVCPLSSLSSRMRHLQEKLLAPMVRVRLAADAAGEHKRLAAACAGGDGKPAKVELWKATTVLLRQFLPPDEGGVDQGEPMRLADLRGFTLLNDPTEVRMPRRQRFSYELVPWTELPALFQDNTRVPYNIGLGQRVRDMFARPFMASALEPGKVRDLMLRGRYSTAVPQLVKEREEWRRQQQQRANAADLDRRVNEWVDQAIKDYALLLRARDPAEREAAEQRVKALWGERQAEPIFLLLLGAIGTARNPEVTYLLGLCSQEQAEQLQARVDLQKRTRGTPDPSDVDVKKANQAWQDALYTWTQYREDYPKHAAASAARRMRGRAEAMLGDHQAALASWKDLSGSMTDLEKLASLYLARQLEQQHAPKDK
jgi:hypothetical protein